MSPVLDSATIRRDLGLDPREEGGGRRYTSFVIDSRDAEEGSLFFALSGARHEGFDFVGDAARRGARGAVVPDDRPLPELELEWFPVPDPRQAMARLASRVRGRADARVVGITGSSGKTTVKEMVAAALGGAPRIHKTEGNLNSQIGLPLSILRAPSGARTWVLELGTNAPGEIARLVEVSAPDHGVVVTVGPAHLEELGDEAGVLEEKLDLVRGVRDGGAVVVGERPPELVSGAREIRPDAVVAGLGEGADWRPEEWSVEAEAVTFRRNGVRYRVEAGGEHHLRDAVIAAALAEELGAEPRSVARGLEEFRPLGMRGALRSLGGLTVVADCYNANPESFAAAVDYCEAAFPDRRLVAAVGSMLELGDRSEEAHREVAARLRDAGFRPVVATGEFVPAFRELGGWGRGPDPDVVPAGDAEEAGRRLVERLEGDEVVLVKGSRGAGLETAVRALEEAFG